MLLSTTVHATGINWEAIGVISTILIAVGGWIGRKLTAITTRLDNQDRAKYAFEQSVGEQHKELGERLARLEGPVKRTEQAVT